jgi:3-oxoacyl-[acyl-carrier-protein] synthase II
VRDVTITGMSVFTPRAATLEDFWTSLSTPHGMSAGRVHTVVDDLIVSSIAAADRRRCARSTQLALAGALAAIDDSGLDDATVATRDRRGVLLGTGFGASNELIEAAALLSERGPRFVSPVLAVLAIPEAAASAVANRLAARARSLAQRARPERSQSAGRRFSSPPDCATSLSRARSRRCCPT